MRKLINRFLRRERGVAAVEFGLTIAGFLFVLFAFFELAYLCVMSAGLDYIVAESTKYAKNEQIAYNVQGEAALDLYRKAAIDTTNQMIDRIIGGSRVLSMVVSSDKEGKNNRIIVNICQVNRFDQIQTTLETMINNDGDCPFIQAGNDYYYPYAIYQYHIKYKSMFSWIPVYGNLVSNLLVRRYVALQEWKKIPKINDKEWNQPQNNG